MLSGRIAIRRIALLGAVLVAVASTVLCPIRAEVRESGPRLFAAHALALRAAGVAGERSAAKILTDMPGVPLTGAEESLPVLWTPFFENAIVRLGRVQSSAPVALYYNPLLDVAVFTAWERRQRQYHVASIRALPGEHLADAKADVPSRPP